MGHHFFPEASSKRNSSEKFDPLKAERHHVNQPLSEPKVSQGLNNEKRDAYCDHVQKMFDEMPMHELVELLDNLTYPSEDRQKDEAMHVNMPEFWDDFKVSLEREKLIGVKPLKEKKCLAPELLPDTIESSANNDDFELLIESTDSI